MTGFPEPSSLVEGRGSSDERHDGSPAERSVGPDPRAARKDDGEGEAGPRYRRTFDRLRQRGDGAFMPFLMLGDPDLQTSGRLLQAAVDGGADMLEVGIPFSDPVADGPVVQAAAERALAGGATTAACLDVLRTFRTANPDIPVGILTYANIALARGREAFFAACAEAGVDSVLIADVPAFEAEPWVRAATAAGVALVMIAAQNTPEEALARVADLGGGYTYCLARAGVTGVDQEVRLDHGALTETLRRLQAPPAILGFGISKPEHVRAALDAGAAGAVSGSAVVQRIAAAESADAACEAVRAFTAEMKGATLGALR